MSERRSILVAAALVLTGAAACSDARSGRESPDAAAPAAGLPADSHPPPVAVDTTPVAVAAPDSALAVTLRRGAPGTLVLSGATRAAERLEVTVEDGHRVLFGPTEVPVVDGRFHLELTPDATDQQVVSAFITSPDGARQWVVSLHRDSAEARAGA